MEKHGMIDALGASILYEDMLSRLEETHLRKLEKLFSNLIEYIRKNNYASREEITSEEAAAWIRAIEALKGYDASTTILEPSATKVERRESMINKILANLLGKAKT